MTQYLRSIVTGDSLVFDRIANHSFWVDGQNLVPNDPFENKPKKLEVTYSYDGEPPKTIRRTEGDRLTLPEDSAMAWLGNELNKAKAELDRLKAAQPKPSRIPPLRLTVIEMVSELQGFLGSHGSEPKVERQLPETPDEFMTRFRAIVQPWRERFNGEYRLKFGESMPRLRDEIGARTGMNTSFLAAAIDAMGNTAHPDETIQKLIGTLWTMALEINA